MMTLLRRGEDNYDIVEVLLSLRKIRRVRAPGVSDQQWLALWETFASNLDNKFPTKNLEWEKNTRANCSRKVHEIEPWSPHVLKKINLKSFIAISDNLWSKVFLSICLNDSCMKSQLNQIQSHFKSLISYLKTTSMTVLPTSCSNWCRYIPPPGYSLRKPDPCGIYQVWCNMIHMSELELQKLQKTVHYMLQIGA